MKSGLWKGIAVVAFLLTGLPGGAAGQSQGLPQINLGFTTFVDGAPPAGPGLYFQQYVQYIYADELKDGDGNEARLPLPDGSRPRLMDSLDVWVSLSQLIYQSDMAIPLIGAKWGLDVIVPLISIDVDQNDAIPVPVLTGNHQGMGDLWVGPYLQWDPIMGEKGPIFMHRIEFQNIIPVGKYDDDRVINQGSNFYSFNPYWSATVFASPHCTVSWRLHYLWNAKNEDPNETFFPGADDTQAGQALHLNWATAYEIIPNQFRAGINGYWLSQITDAKTDGKKVNDSREQIGAVGPGLVWHISQDDHIFFNTYFEFAGENRPEGMRFNARWTHHF